MEFQENLKYQPDNIKTVLRIYVETLFVNENEERFVKFNILGKFILNEDHSDSFSKDQIIRDKNNLFQTEYFPNYVKKIEIIPSYNEYFEKPLKLDKRDLIKLKHEKDFSDRLGFSLK